jgi:tetratricopeptide (TPR) repeat protein
MWLSSHARFRDFAIEKEGEVQPNPFTITAKMNLFSDTRREQRTSVETAALAQGRQYPCIRPFLQFLGCALLLLFLAIEAPSQVQASRTSSTISELLMRGFDSLRAGPAHALPIFEEIVRKDSANLLAQRQLGSIYLALDRPSDALNRFDAAYRLMPSDSTLLQIAYLYNSLGENGKALALFGLLQGSRNTRIAATARRATDVLTPLFCADHSDWWTRAIGSVYYDDRFMDAIVSMSLQEGLYLSKNRLTSFYGTLTLNADSRSTGGTVPVIYSDNYALAGLGFRFQPMRTWTLDIQPGVSVDLLDRPEEERVQADFRALTAIGAGFSPVADVPFRLTTPLSPFIDGFLSFGYYSRYENSIGYSQARAGLRTLAYRHSALDLYLRGDFTFDTRGDFFNNTVEGSVGARLVPDHRWGLGLLVEYHRGMYGVPPPPGSSIARWYNSFRVLLVVDRYLCL